jgi:hypothetical protein
VRNPLAAHPPGRQLTIIAILLPMMFVLAVLAFAWPAARLAPRHLPVGIVGSRQVVSGLTFGDPGGYDVRLYVSEAAARSAIEDRDVYGAFVVGRGGVTVLEASAGGPAVAQLLSTVGQHLAAVSVTAGGVPRQAAAVRDVDVVPLSAGDPRGLVLPSALLPLTICGVIMASIVGLVLSFRPAWRQVMALIVVSATAGLGVYLIVQGFLGALPHEAVATWAALSLTLLAISATLAGLIALIGAAGLGLGIALMIFVGNSFSGVTSAPQLLPSPAGAIGQWLPPGAGAELLRSTAYFGGHGAADHLTVLVVWAVLGLAAIAIGHHAPVRFAARRAWKPGPAVSWPDEPARPHDHGSKQAIFAQKDPRS